MAHRRRGPAHGRSGQPAPLPVRTAPDRTAARLRTGFRAAPSTVPALRPSRRQSIALLAVLVAVAGTLAAVSYLVRPERARAFDLLNGSLFLSDSLAPVAVDLASGRPTERLVDADAQVGARSSTDVSVVPLQQGTLLLDTRTGEFNMVAGTGFVVKRGGGVPLAAQAGSRRAVAVPNGQLAYIEQTGSSGTSVYLVGQATVETASDVGAKVQPRAFRSMSLPGSIAPGAAASARGALWTLLGSGGDQVVRELRVPADSNAGATLRSTDHGHVTGPAALEAASAGSAAAVVGLASAHRIRIFAGNAATSVDFPGIVGADRILPVGEAGRRLAYLVHGSAGWYVVSVATDGSALRGPTRLSAVPAADQLAAPATSRGSLYTVDRSSGQLFRVHPDGSVSDVDGLAQYPLARQGARVVETRNFGDAYAIARGPRVILNSPEHQDAVVVFTDGRHAPLTISKSSAVAVDAAGGVDALTHSRIAAHGARRAAHAQHQKQRAPDSINNRIDCRTANQKPHIPSITGAQPGSRSVLVTWSYPLLSRQDCVPSTYVVGIRLLSDSAPQPPSQVRVQGQQSVNVTGLFPSTDYAITVTAYIHGRGTTSRDRRITTGPAGPAAPRNVAATTDSRGDWNVTWSSCGTTRNGCVPASSWKVIPQFCDGRGLSGTPASITVTADPTATRQPPAQLRGGTALLGRGLRFQVEGTGEQGTVGDPSGFTPCVTSWSPPDASTMRLSASRPRATSLGGATTTTVSLDLGDDPVRDAGGVGAKVAFTLDGGGTRVTKDVTVGGGDSHVSAGFDNVHAGATYQASASVSPPGHDGSAVSLSPVPVSTRADWPALTLDARCPKDGALGCNLAVQINGLSSAQAHGEVFDLGSSSGIRCQNNGQTLTRSGFDPANTTIGAGGTLYQFDGYYGTCTVSISLVESSSDSRPLVFGGKQSRVFTTSVPLGAPAQSGAGAGDFTASWQGGGLNGDYAQVNYTGNADLNNLTQGWSEVVHPPGSSQDCGDASATPPVRVSVSATCVYDYGGSTSAWTVEITFHDRSDNTQHGPYSIDMSGSPPGYQPCAPSGFSATWGTTRTIAVGVADPAADAGCTAWSYRVTDANGNSVCFLQTRAAAGSAPPTTIYLTLCGTPPAAGWILYVDWHDPLGNNHGSGGLEIAGTPPP